MGYEPLLAMRGEETLIWTSKSREKVQVFDFRFVRVGIVHAWRRESHTVTQIQQELWTRTDHSLRKGNDFADRPYNDTYPILHSNESGYTRMP